MHVFYRYSDASNIKTSNPIRPEGFDKRKILLDFLHVFNGHQIHIIADNVNTSSIEWLTTLGVDVEVTSLGSGDDSWVYSMKKAISSCRPEEFVYLVEDDYIHLPGSPEVLEWGLRLTDYATLYDHPDKYKNGFNPYIKDNGEVSLIRQTPDGTHWKFTNSTTETHGARVSALIRDIKMIEDILHDKQKIIEKHYSLDSIIWLNILQRTKIACCMPGYASHLHIPWVTVNPAIDKYIKNIFYC